MGHIADGMTRYARYATEALVVAIDSPDPSTRLLALNRAICNADACLHAEVDALRSSGVTWQQIGEYLGITRQGAQKRFGGPA